LRLVFAFGALSLAGAAVPSWEGSPWAGGGDAADDIRLALTISGSRLHRSEAASASE